jgi:hypothetical protein
MLSQRLEDALEDLRDLIKITKSDIEDIKVAQNEPQFERLSLKEEKLKSFEEKKAMIDREISTLMTTYPEKPLPELIQPQEHLLLDQLKEELNNLREVNKEYAKLVILVSNVYNSFLERLVPTEMQGYERVASKESKILKVRV